MSTLSPQDRLKWLVRLSHAGGLLITLAIWLGAVIYIYGPMAHQSNALQTQAAAADRLLEQRQVIQAEHQQMKRTVADTKVRLQDLQNRIPQESREWEFLGQLARLADETRIGILDYQPIYKPTELVTLKTYYEMEVKLSAEGTYPSLCQFLHRLRKLPRLCRVTNMTIESSRQERGVYPLHLTLRIYFAPEFRALSEERKDDHG